MVSPSQQRQAQTTVQFVASTCSISMFVICNNVASDGVLFLPAALAMFDLVVNLSLGSIANT